MGNNERDNRSKSDIIINTKNGIADIIRIETYLPNNQHDYLAFGFLDNNNQYTDIRQAYEEGGNPLENGGSCGEISPEAMVKKVTDFVVQNNSRYKFNIKIDGKEVNYDGLCKALGKSEILINTKGLSHYGAINSKDSIHNNLNYGNIEKPTNQK